MSREIDAVNELEIIEGRGQAELSSTARRLPPGAKALIIIAVAIGVVLTTLVVVKGQRLKAAAEAQQAEAGSHTPATRIGTGGREFTPARIPPETAAAEASPADVPSQETPITPAPVEPSPVATNHAATAPSQPGAKPEPTPEQLLLERRLSADLTGVGSSGGNSMNTAPAQARAEGGSTGSGALADNMQPIRFNGAKAAFLPNRDLLVTQGEMIDCQLETRLITDQAGQVTCFLTRDVYSTSKRVVMMEKGSKVVGQYQRGVTQGQARIFVLWTRVETNKGVVINLDSSGAGPLGEAGVGGWVDTHFWQRFGGAIMLSMIDDVGDFVSRKASGNSGSNSDRITFDNTSDSSQDMAAEALRHTIDIPPTLYKNHGERVQIFVARDLDFSEVYTLERS